MPDIALSDPIGQESEQWYTTQRVEEYQYDPAVTTPNLTNGMVVVLYGGYLPGTGDETNVTTSQYPVIRQASTTPGYNNVGVVVNAPTGGYAPGSIVQVCVGGIAQVLCDANNTTFGKLLVAGSTTAGAATAASTPTEGETIAVCLATTTISSGTALVYGLMRLI
jgi:hypothetical protein